MQQSEETLSGERALTFFSWGSAQSHGQLDAVINAFGKYSMAHFNPAVTIAGKLGLKISTIMVLISTTLLLTTQFIEARQGEK